MKIIEKVGERPGAARKLYKIIIIGGEYEMSIESLSLLNILEGYIRNYRKLNLFQASNTSMYTKREIGYFETVGEYLGFFSFVEGSKPNYDYGRSRPMDLSWWKWDERVSTEFFSNLVLHLERENIYSKDLETIDKLFCNTDEEYVPDYVIGIVNVETVDRIKELHNEVLKRNKIQRSEVLMIYCYYDDRSDFERVEAYYCSSDLETVVKRDAISKIDDAGYWMMCNTEEYKK